MKTVTVNVNREHINRGHRRSCVDCPIALAVNEQLKAYPSALVVNGTISFGYQGFMYLRKQSKAVNDFIRQFDNAYTDAQVENLKPLTLRFRVKEQAA